MIFMLYRHFNVLFESQHELTSQIIATLVAMKAKPLEKDFLYGVSYETTSEEE